MIKTFNRRISNISSNDMKISISIMSPFVVLIIQYLFLFYFGIMDTQIGNILQLVSKMFVGLFYLYSLFIVLKRNTFLFIMIYLVLFGIILLNYFFFSQNMTYLNGILIPLFLISLPSFIFSFSVNDKQDFMKVVKKISIVIYIVGIIIGVLVFTKRISLVSYSMSISYYLLLPTVILIYDFLENYNIKSAILAMLPIIIILSIGSRGPIICVGIYIILYQIINIRRIDIKRLSFNLLFLLLIALGFLYYRQILIWISNLLNNIGIYSRSISIFLRGEFYLSGRNQIYEEVIDLIKANPIFGIGVAGDRLYMGTYSHNIILEIVSSFGLIIGFIIILMLSIIIIYSLFSRKKEESNFLLIWFIVGVVPLFVSGSYLTYFQFWIYLGLAIRFVIDRRFKLQ